MADQAKGLTGSTLPWAAPSEEDELDLEPVEPEESLLDLEDSLDDEVSVIVEGETVMAELDFLGPPGRAPQTDEEEEITVKIYR